MDRTLEIIEASEIKKAVKALKGELPHGANVEVHGKNISIHDIELPGSRKSFVIRDYQKTIGQKMAKAGFPRATVEVVPYKGNEAAIFIKVESVLWEGEGILGRIGHGLAKTGLLGKRKKRETELPGMKRRQKREKAKKEKRAAADDAVKARKAEKLKRRGVKRPERTDAQKKAWAAAQEKGRKAQR